MTILEVQNLSKNFGGLVANKDINMKIVKKSITAVIGPNGAGKTTFFNLITGVYTPSEGDILFEGNSIVKLKPHNVSKKGISRTFQNIRLFNELTVLENVMIGLHKHLKASVMGILFQLPSVRRESENSEVEAFKWLQYVGLEQYVNEKAKNLPYGAQRRLEIARALASKPSLLLLDEPAAGMNPRETKELTVFIKKIRDDFDITICLIEHDMRLVMEISEHIIVLDHGVRIADGTPAEIRNNPLVIEAYLGKGAAEMT